MTAGYAADPKEVLARVFTEKNDQMVTVRRIAFTSLCEHHVLPFTGYVTVGYLPNGKVVGLSKIPRVIEVFARRLQVQERFTEQIADAMQSFTDARGVGVIVVGKHSRRRAARGGDGDLLLPRRPPQQARGPCGASVGSVRPLKGTE